MKKLLALFLVLSTLCTLSTFTVVGAVGLPMEIIQTPTSLINSYFSEKNALLMNEDNAFDSYVLFGVAEDEQEHREVLSDSQVSIIDFSYEIVTLDTYEELAEAEVVETIVYNDGTSEDITHFIRMNITENLVLCDNYHEEKTGFASRDYVNPDVAAETNALTGSAPCFVRVAQMEVGYLEKASNSNLYSKTANAGSANYTKYGAWYGVNPGEWCAMFVSWCAYEVNIPTSIIFSTSGVVHARDTYIERGIMHDSAVLGGSYTPEIGDLCFFNTDGDWSQPDHIGIVANVSGSTVRIIEGNSDNAVESNYYNLSSSSLYGFANPPYISSGHNWVASGTGSVCSVCGLQSGETA